MATTDAETLILRWHVDSPYENLFDGEHRAEAERYLRAVEEIRRMSLKQSEPSSPSSSSVGKSLQMAMTRLQAEFRKILLTRFDDVDSTFLDSSLSSISMSSRFVKSFADSDFSLNRSNRSNFEVEPEEDEEEEGEEEREGNADDSPRNSNSVFAMDLAPSDVVHDLRSIAEKMITAGYSQECCQVYSAVRKDAIDHCLQLLGVQNLSVAEVRRLPWDTVDVMIRRWIHASRVCVRVVFSSEKRFCDLIFGGLDDDEFNNSSGKGSGSGSTSVSDQAFAETAKGAAFQLLGFAEAISTGNNSSEKLFKIVELYDALRDLLTDIEAIFCGPCSSINSQAREILSQLEETVWGILSDFANAIHRDYGSTPVPGGTLHPITRYVMNYINLISEYKTVLSDLIISDPSVNDISNLELHVDDGDEDRSPLAAHLVRIVGVLVANLDSKSNLYRDPALTQIFIMNNTHYIVKKVKESPVLMEMIGDRYLRRLTGKYRSAATNYHRATWVGVLNCLRDEGIHISPSLSSSSGISKTTLRERFKSFNAAFDESHRTQASWVVPDDRLKDELKIMISERLLPAYRSFFGRYHQIIENGRQPHVYLKYTGDDLERAIEDFFEGEREATPYELHNPHPSWRRYSFPWRRHQEN